MNKKNINAINTFLKKVKITANKAKNNNNWQCKCKDNTTFLICDRIVTRFIFDLI